MKNVIKKYVENLCEEDVKNFIKKSNYQINDNEISIIYYYIKNYCDDILDGKQEVFEKFKKEVSTSTYLEVMRLCDKYKKWL